MTRSIRYSLSDGEKKSLQVFCESIPQFDLGDIVGHIRSVLTSSDCLMQSKMSEIVRKLRSLRTSPGLIVLENLPHLAEPRSLSVVVGELVGSVVKFQNEGDFLIEIKEQVTKPGERPNFKNSKEFYLHTDLSYVEAPPHFLFMHAVVNNPGEGGISVFADIEKAVLKLGSLEVSELQKPQFLFPSPPHYAGGGTVRFPILTQDESSGAWKVRFRRDNLRTESRAGMDAVVQLIKAFDDTAEETLLQSDSLVLIDNRTFLHGRTAFLSRSGSSEARHLNRIYVNVDS